jgi:catechol 2,3-dioxygenase-like lactoylglutathione lyase family enzyme
VLDGARIFHVNVNCRDLGRSRSFYVQGCGLSEGVRTTPDGVQSGVAFGLDQARWDAWILVGSGGFDGGAIDLLEWSIPAPTGEPPLDPHQPGFRSVGLVVADVDATVARATAHGGVVVAGVQGEVWLRDPDGVLVTLVEGDGPRVGSVSVTTADLVRSVDFYLALGFRAAAASSDGRPESSARSSGGAADGAVVLDSPSPGEVQLELVPIDGPVAGPATARPANAVGIWRTALVLGGLDVAVAALGTAGIELISPVQSMAMGPGLPQLRFVCFRGPDGEVIELIEQP